MGLDNPIHIMFLGILLLLVFGAKRLPEMGHSLGSGMRGFRDALSGESTTPSLTAVQAQPQDSSVLSPVAEAVPIGVQTPVAQTASNEAPSAA
jgi:sec-independent protein translocase protein TatA